MLEHADPAVPIVSLTILGVPIADIVNLLIVVYLVLHTIEPVSKIVAGVRRWFARWRK